MPVLLAALASLAVTAGASAAAPPAADADALVRRCVEAYGGNAAIAKAARARQEGTVTSLVLHPGEKGRMARAYERPGRLRVEIAYPGGSGEVRVLQGARGWRDGEEVSGPRLQAMILQVARLDLPARLSSPGARVASAGTLELGGKTLRVLAFEPAPGLVVEVAIDPASGRILRSRGAARDGTPGLDFVTTYSEFRTISGVLVAMREESWANGRTTGETVLEKVEFPAALPDGMFAP
ncbi:MAG: hypothetical protein ACJ79E_08610 [Anaeromyxobacteraceae bacterium]